MKKIKSKKPQQLQKISRQYQTLKKGDIVDIVAPAYGIKPQEVAKIKTYIESLGLKARIPEDLLQGDLIASAPVQVRFKHLKDALTNSESKAVWAIKGGSGSPEIIPLLAKLKKPAKQKLFIAFSDNTSIHFFLNQNWGWQTVHGPILWQIIRNRIDQESITQVENLLFGKNIVTDFAVKPINTAAKKAGTIKADAFIGGNLKLVQCSIGTLWQIKAKNKILLFEDINEKPYQLDRILVHIQQSGLINGAAAILFSDFEGGEIEMDLPLIEKVLQKFADKLKIPVYRTSGIGHTKRNYAVHFGVPAEISNNKLKLAKLI